MFKTVCVCDSCGREEAALWGWGLQRAPKPWITATFDGGTEKHMCSVVCANSVLNRRISAQTPEAGAEPETTKVTATEKTHEN